MWNEYDCQQIMQFTQEKYILAPFTKIGELQSDVNKHRNHVEDLDHRSPGSSRMDRGSMTPCIHSIVLSLLGSLKPEDCGHLVVNKKYCWGQLQI